MPDSLTRSRSQCRPGHSLGRRSRANLLRLLSNAIEFVSMYPRRLSGPGLISEREPHERHSSDDQTNFALKSSPTLTSRGAVFPLPPCWDAPTREPENGTSVIAAAARLLPLVLRKTCPQLRSRIELEGVRSNPDNSRALARFPKEIDATLRPRHASGTIGQFLRSADIRFEHLDDRIKANQMPESLTLHVRHLSCPLSGARPASPTRRADGAFS